MIIKENYPKKKQNASYLDLRCVWRFAMLSQGLEYWGANQNTSQIQHGFILFFNLSILLWLLLQADEAVDEAVADVADDVADASEAAAGAVG